MNRNVVIVVLVLVVLVAAVSYKLFFNQEEAITATGTIEIRHADVMPRINGYLSELAIEVGDRVHKGQIIARIERLDMREQLIVDEAAAAKAKAQLADLEKGPRQQEIDQAAANLAAAKSVYEKADVDFVRYQTLYQNGAIAAQQMDVARSNHEVAYNALSAAKSQYDLLLSGYREDLIIAQRREVERTDAAVAVTKANLADTIVYSPLTGIVLTKNYEQGEYVNPGSAITTVGDTNDCWVKVYVSSAQLGLIKMEQSVDVKIDAYPERIFSGKIKEISQNAEFTPRQSITKTERTNLVYYVKVKVENSEGILKPGMPADVVFR